MRHHVLAYQFLTGAGGVTDGQMTPVPEQAFTISGGGNFQTPWPLNIFAAWAGGTGINRARINTGSLRARGFPQIYPLGVGQQPVPPIPLMDFRNYPLNAAKEEDLRIDLTTTAAVNQFSALVWVSPEPMNVNVNPQADLRWLRFTATVTAAANGWSTPTVIALQDVVEGGIYDIYGLGVQSPTGIAARLILQGEFFRPGCLMQGLLTGKQSDMFAGGLGKWGSFNSYSLPQIETYDTAAGGSVLTGWILCCKSMGTTNVTVPTGTSGQGY